MNARHVAGAVSPPDGQYDADVIIPAFDRPEETAAAIHSALAQTGVSRHVFIVDQGSRPENLARLATEVSGRSDATLVELDRNHGVAGGRNRGTALGHGRIIFGLDNDAEFANATTLARAVAALDEDAGLAAIGCRIRLHEGDGDDLSSWGYPCTLLPSAGESFDAVTFVGAGHAIRRIAWDGYDEALFFCWEELDFCLRAIERGWRVRYRGDIVVRHKVSPEQRFAWSGNRWFHFVRNRLYISRKWGASWSALLPRLGFYLVKGARNGLLMQTLRAITASARLASDVTPRRHSATALRYICLNDAAHRHNCLVALWHACRDHLGRDDRSWTRQTSQHERPSAIAV